TEDSEKAPRSESPATTRSARMSGEAAFAAPSSTRRRSAASTSRAASMRRRRGSAASAGCRSTRVTMASTPGRARSRGCTSAFRGKLSLHAGAHASNDLARLVTDGFGPGMARVGLQEPPHRLLGEPRPQLLEITGREALTAQRGDPLLRQLLDEAVPLDGQTARALHELGQLGRHRLFFHVPADGIHEVRLPAGGGHALVVGIGLELARLAQAERPHFAVDLELRGLPIGADEDNEGDEGLALQRLFALAPPVR